MRPIEVSFVKHGLKHVVFAGSDEETKPTEGICDGSVYIATDTKKVYLYDEANETWRQW